MSLGFSWNSLIDLPSQVCASHRWLAALFAFPSCSVAVQYDQFFSTQLPDRSFPYLFSFIFIFFYLSIILLFYFSLLSFALYFLALFLSSSRDCIYLVFFFLDRCFSCLFSFIFFFFNLSIIFIFYYSLVSFTLYFLAPFLSSSRFLPFVFFPVVMLFSLNFPNGRDLSIPPCSDWRRGVVDTD